MDLHEQVVNCITKWLADVGKLGFTVTKQLLARLETWERVLLNMRPQNWTYRRACAIFIDSIVPRLWTDLISKGTHPMRQGKSDLPAILQPKLRQLKGYLENLEDKNKEIDSGIQEIEEKLKERNYKLTVEQKFEMEMLLMDVEAKSKQLKTYFEEAGKTLDSLSFDVESYGSSGWNGFLSVVVGAGAAGLVVSFLPVGAPAAAACGGGIVAGISRYLNAGKGNDVDLEKLKTEIKQLQSLLEQLKTELKVKEPVIGKLKEQIKSKVRITNEFCGEI